MQLYDGDCKVFANHIELEDPFVLQLLEGAEAALEARTGRDYADFSKAALAGEEPVRDACWVIYEKTLGLKPAIQFDAVPRLQADKQQFRAISEIMEERRANCLELALLFASCAIRAHLKPVIITLDSGQTDHAFVGIWLSGTGPKRLKSCQPDGSIAREKVPKLLGLDSISGAEDYWNRISRSDMLVVDCAGAAFGYPGKDSRHGLRFERAVTRAWTMLTSQSSKIRCVLDLCQARREIPFPVKIRPDFVGREDDLQAIAETADSKNIAVCGNVGVGKSALALEYAFEFRQEYPEGVFRLNAANEDGVLEQLADFARECGMDSNWRQGPSGEPPNKFQLASRWAEHVNKHGDCTLLILDDVASASFVTAPIADTFVPTAEVFSLSSLKCRLLITTRNSELLPDDEHFKSILLAPLSVDDGAALLLNALPQDRRDKRVAKCVCRQLDNLPLLIRVAGQTLSGDGAPTLLEYEQKLLAEGLHPVIETALPPDYPGRSVKVVLNQSWDDLACKTAVSCEILKLLSILPRNESVPFELLALMVEIPADGQTVLDLVREGSKQLWASGLAEQPEQDTIRVHTFVHEFAAEKTASDSGFFEEALHTAARRLHEADFYQARKDQELVRCGEQLRLLREPSRLVERLSQVVDLFDIQLDYLREEYDALSQLAMHAHLVGANDLAKILEQVRIQRKGPWFRLRWHGSHERNHGPEAAGHSDAVSAVATWPSQQDMNPTVAVSGAENGEIIVWPLDSLTPRRRLIKLEAPVSGLCISPDGQTIYVSARDGSLRAVSLDDSPLPRIRILGRHAYPANDCAIDPDGEFVVSVSDNGTVHIYNLPEGRFRLARGHLEHAPLLKCAVARCSRSGEPVMITASEAGVVRAWNPLKGEEIREKLRILPQTAHYPISACALSPDGELAAVATRDNVLLWNLNTGEELNLSIREPYVAGLCFSPDGSRLMLVGRSKQVAIYRVEDRSCDYRTDPWYHWLTACAFGAGGRLFYASDDGSLHTRKYSYRTGKVTGETSVSGRLNWVNVFRAGESYALSVSTDQSICLWHLESGKLERTIPGSANWVNAFAVSSDGEHVLSGTDHGKVIYWSLQNNADKQYLKGFLERANACAISSDGEIALAASEDSTLRQWSLTPPDFIRGKHLTDGHCAAVRTCAISPDSRYALSGGDDEEVVLWDLESGEFEKSFKKHKGRITAVEFVQDQPDIFVSSSWDNTVKCWNARSGLLLRDFTEHTDGVTSCGTATGGVAFSVSLDRTLRRWRLEDGPSDMRIHLEHRLRGLVVDPSGGMVLCSDMSGTVFLFDVMGSYDSTSPSTGTNCELSSV